MAYQGTVPSTSNIRMRSYTHKHIGWGNSLFAWEQARGEVQIKLPKETIAVYTTMVTPMGKYTTRMNMGERKMRSTMKR